MRVIDDFGKRPDEYLQVKARYFLIFEGECTEPMYFDGIRINREELALNEYVSLINVYRSINEKHNSHPKHLIKMADNIIKESMDNIITKEVLLHKIVDYLSFLESDNKSELISMAKNYIDKYANDEINYNEVNNIIFDIYKDLAFDNISESIVEYLEEQHFNLDYREGIDIICLIVDRDKNNFSEEQYDKLVEKCKQQHIKLYVSNSCFEVWLLMHFEEFKYLDKTRIIENKRINGKKNSRKYVDKALSDITGYDKSNLNFDVFKDRVELAIKQEKEYCENVEELKYKMGSNVGLLIQDMQKKS